MVTDGDTYHGGHWGMYRIVKLLYCIPKTNVTLYVNHTLIIHFLKGCWVEISTLWIHKMLKKLGANIRQKSKSSAEGSEGIILKIRVPGKTAVFGKNRANETAGLGTKTRWITKILVPRNSYYPWTNKKSSPTLTPVLWRTLLGPFSSHATSYGTVHNAKKTCPSKGCAQPSKLCSNDPELASKTWRGPFRIHFLVTNSTNYETTR